MFELVLLFFIALVANGLSALAGGGAGLLQLPALLFLGLPFPVALATHKIASVALGVGATVRHAKEKRLEWPMVALMLGFGLPGVVLGATLILDVPEMLATLLLGFLTTGLGLHSLLSPTLGMIAHPKHRQGIGLLIGGLGLLTIGVLNGSITSGTGLFVTLWLVRWFGMDYQRAVAHTLILVGMFWNGGGALTLALQADVQWSWLPALVLGSLLGGFLGAHLAIAKGNRLVKRCFEAVTMLVGMSLIAKAFGA